MISRLFDSCFPTCVVMTKLLFDSSENTDRRLDSFSKRRMIAWRRRMGTFIMLSIQHAGFCQYSLPDTLAVLLSSNFAMRPPVRCLNSWILRIIIKNDRHHCFFAKESNGGCVFEQCSDPLPRHRVVKARCVFLF